MPKQKDLKRIVRARMQKTGESYTAARLQLVKKTEPDYAALAGMSDTAVKAKTGRNWSEWVAKLDAARAAEKPHREIAQYVSDLGTPDWWTQTVTVGYERIRGLREIGQRRGGAYEATKSRTFPVSTAKLYKAFADARQRAKWLPVKIKVRTKTANKSMRITWDDDTSVQVGFYAKGAGRSQVAVQHSKLADKAAIARTKSFWAERFDALAEMFG